MLQTAEGVRGRAAAKDGGAPPPSRRETDHKTARRAGAASPFPPLTPLESLPLRRDVKLVLAAAGVRRLKDFALMSRKEIATCRNVGETTVAKVEEWLTAIGLSLAKGNDQSARMFAALGIRGSTNVAELKMHIGDRACELLARNGITTLSDLQAFEDHESLNRIPGIDSATVAKIKLIVDLSRSPLVKPTDRTSHDTESVGAQGYRLTLRQREVLQWVSAGKTAWATGVIMSLTERTVVMHLQGAMRAMNATSKYAAAQKAASLGLL